MREMTATPDTSTSVRERLAAINNRHADNLKRLYEWEAERFRNDAVDHYISYDETIPFTKAEDTVRPTSTSLLLDVNLDHLGIKLHAPSTDNRPCLRNDALLTPPNHPPSPEKTRLS